MTTQADKSNIRTTVNMRSKPTNTVMRNKNKRIRASIRGQLVTIDEALGTSISRQKEWWVNFSLYYTGQIVIKVKFINVHQF